MTELNSPPDSKLVPSLVLAVGILSLSSTAIFIKIAIRELSPEAVVFDRLLFSTIIFTSWYWGKSLWSSSRARSDNTPDENEQIQPLQAELASTQDADLIYGVSRTKWLIAGLLLAMAIAQLAARLVWTWSLEYTTAANGTMLANMPPLFTALGGWLFLGQRFDRRFLTGIAVAMVGAVVLAMGDWLYPEAELFGTMAIIGDIAALMSSAFYAAGYLVIEKLRQYLSTAEILVWRCVLGLIMIAPFVLVIDKTLFPTSVLGWLAILGLSFVSEVIGHGSVVYVLKYFSSAFITTAFLLEPLPVATYAWLVLGEFLSASSGVGFILITIGIYLAKTGKGADSQLQKQSDEASEKKILQPEKA